MDTPGRTLRRRKLGKALKVHRDNAGLSVRELAKRSRLSAATISKIENGLQAILPRNVQLILQACGVGAPELDNLIRIAEGAEDVAWWLTYTDTMPDWFAAFVDLESDAEEIKTYTSEIVDGLLQTRDYAAVVAKRSAETGLTDAQIDRSVDLREARQARLDRLQMHVVMSEVVIRRGPSGDPAADEPIMREQMARLAELAERPNITLQVLLLSAGLHAGVRGPFTLMRFPEGYDDMDCVYIETENGGVWQERASDIERYGRVFASVCGLAISPEETRTLLASLT